MTEMFKSLGLCSSGQTASECVGEGIREANILLLDFGYLAIRVELQKLQIGHLNPNPESLATRNGGKHLVSEGAIMKTVSEMKTWSSSCKNQLAISCLGDM